MLTKDLTKLPSFIKWCGEGQSGKTAITPPELVAWLYKRLGWPEHPELTALLDKFLLSRRRCTKNGKTATEKKEEMTKVRRAAV